MNPTRSAVELPFDVNAPATARAFVARQVPDLAEERLDDVLLCVSELATNALVHGAPDLSIGATVGSGVVTVAITDRGSGRPAGPHDPGIDETRGRGLLLVSLLAVRWGVRDADDGGAGKTVWCDVPTSSAPAASGPAS